MEMLQVEHQGLLGGPGRTEVQAVCAGPPVLEAAKGVTRVADPLQLSRKGTGFSHDPTGWGTEVPRTLPLSDPQNHGGLLDPHSLLARLAVMMWGHQQQP